MVPWRGLNLRGRLLLVVLLAVLPMVGLALVMAAEQRRRVVEYGLTDSELQPSGAGENDPGGHHLLPAAADTGADEE